MGRSVSTPVGTIATAYAQFNSEIGECDDFQYEVVEPFVDDLRCHYPSVYSYEGWAGREDQIVARNAFADFGVSEYCGLVAYWARPRQDLDRDDLATAWVSKIAPAFEERFGSLRKLGHFSNGEAVFERRAAA